VRALRGRRSAVVAAIWLACSAAFGVASVPAHAMNAVSVPATLNAAVPVAAAGSAVAVPPAPAAPLGAPDALDEVIVTGEQPGPGLWHVHRGAAHLWILGTVSPLPKDMTWRTAQVEAVLATADEALLAKPFDLGIARALWLLVTQRELFMVPDGKKLRDVLPLDLYARFAAARAKYSREGSKWERYRPVIAMAFLQEAALHRVGLSTRLDIGNEVRTMARKHHVRVDEIKIAGIHDVLDALKTMTPATENKCTAAALATVESDLPRLVERGRAWATGDVERIQGLPEPREMVDCRSALVSDAGVGDLITLVRRSWLTSLDQRLKAGGTTLAVMNMDILLEPGGVLDQLRARGAVVDAPQ
jgi:uncharacterized protein YbaP (TraB family)